MSNAASRRGRRVACVTGMLGMLGVAGSTAASPGPLRSVRMLITASVSGEISECGCVSGPQGGLARRSALIRSLRSEGAELLLLDAGGYASVDPDFGAMLTDSIEAYMAREGYQAVAIGDEELRVGAPPRTTDGGPTYLSANLHVREGDRLGRVGDDYAIVESNGVKVGISAVIDPELLRTVPGSVADYVAGPPIDTARRVERELAEAGADVTVLLVHGGEPLTRLLGRSTGFDVVVVGHRSVARSTHGLDASTVFVYPGDHGRWVADLRLELDELGPAVVAGGVRGLMNEDPRDPDVHRWVSAIEADIRARKRQALIREATTTGTVYRGADACRECHAGVYEDWRRSPHAGAYATLEALAMQDAPECVGCHTVVSGSEAQDQRERRGVECEACHEVPAGHPDPPAVPGVEPAGCRRCHDARNSPDYDPETYWRRVLHVPSSGP